LAHHSLSSLVTGYLRPGPEVTPAPRTAQPGSIRVADGLIRSPG
jgi:hypothetical protein